MAKYALDTNIYIDSLRNAGAREHLKAFLSTHLTTTYLIAVVMQELRTGARTKGQTEALESGVFAPFERRNRVIAPSIRAFKESGRVLAEFATRYKLDISKAGSSFVNDTLIAACCREAGITLVTRDGDYDRIAAHIGGFRHMPPPFP